MLLMILVVAAIQLALVLHVRNTLVDCAGAGARYGALAGNAPSDGAARAQELIGMSLSDRYGSDVEARVVDNAGMETVEVEVVAPIPVIGLLGPGGSMTATGRAVVE